MNAKVNLPARIEVDDYHEFETIQTHLRLVIPGVKVKEAGFKNGKYIGVAYVGTVKENAEFVIAIKEEIDGILISRKK